MSLAVLTFPSKWCTSCLASLKDRPSRTGAGLIILGSRFCSTVQRGRPKSITNSRADAFRWVKRNAWFRVLKWWWGKRWRSWCWVAIFFQWWRITICIILNITKPRAKLQDHKKWLQQSWSRSFFRSIRLPRTRKLHAVLPHHSMLHLHTHTWTQPTHRPCPPLVNPRMLSASHRVLQAHPMRPVWPTKDKRIRRQLW